MSLPRTGAWLDTLRLASGLTLFAFALFHFLNHALGLWSLEAMAAAQHWRLAVTRSGVGTGLLAAALATDLALALWRYARLRTWRLPLATLAALVTGGLVALLLPLHLIEAGLAARAAGGAMSYPAVLTLMYPAKIPTQSLLLALVWWHSCLGLNGWLKGERWWRRHSHLLIALAYLIPAAAVAGVVVAGREVARLKVTQAFPLPYAATELPLIKARAADAQWASLVLMALALGVA